MPRKLTAADVHPSIFEAMKSVRTGMGQADAQAVYMTSAYSEWSKAWFKQYWLGSTVWIASVIPLLLSHSWLRGEIGKGPSALVLIWGIMVWFAAGYALYTRTLRHATWEEIEAIRPVTKFSENQELYLDCVKAVLDSRVLEPSQKRSWLASLNASLDQAIELDKLYADMRDSLGGSSLENLQRERDRIRERMNAAADPTSKEVFRQSLEIAEDRLHRSDGLAGQVERAEAHLELTRQTFIKTKETLRGLEIGAKQSTRIDLEPLRANLASIQDEAHAIRSAIDELAQFRING